MAMYERDHTSRCVNLEWVFGLNKDFKGAVHNLCTDHRKAIFYAVGHTGVVYDIERHQQYLLQGHRSSIVASCASADRRFVATADAEDGLIVVWDVYTFLPIKQLQHTSLNGSPKNSSSTPSSEIRSTGVLAMDMTPDASYIVTLTRDSPQEICLWPWTADDVVSHIIQSEVPTNDFMTHIRFNPEDPSLVVTTSESRVLFWSWSFDSEHSLQTPTEKIGEWKFFSARISSKDMIGKGKSLGKFTQSVFVHGTTYACTGTVDGDIILWDNEDAFDTNAPVSNKKNSMEHERPLEGQKATDKKMVKVVRLHNTGITCLMCWGPYIVSGGVEGYIRFVDHRLRVVAWFEELNGGPVISISFAHEEGKDPFYAGGGHNRIATTTASSMNDEMMNNFTGREFDAPDIVVSTAKAMILHVSSRSFSAVDVEFQKGSLLVQGQDQPIMAIATHPSAHRIAIGGYSGTLHMWDYVARKTLLLALFRQMMIQCIAFDPRGMYLGVGFTNGVVKVLHADKLEEIQSFRSKTSHAITIICFSADSNHFATADTEGRVGLYRYTHRMQDPRKPIEWVFVGRHQTHRAPITGLQFGITPYGEGSRLISVGEDRRLVEYDIQGSDMESGLIVRSVHMITQGAVPTTLNWMTGIPNPMVETRGIHHPLNMLLSEDSIAKDEEGNSLIAPDVLIIPNNEYKIKVFTTDVTRQCIKTVLGPTFGGPINRIHIRTVPFASKASNGCNSPCLLYTTPEKVIGMVRLPLDGNPRSSMGVLAHPNEISCSALSYDGQFFFTAGGRDSCVHQWSLNPELLVIEDGRPRLDHYLDLVEGGKDGVFVKEIIDYFYYAQIRSQGEETTKQRKIEGSIPFSQVPNLMRALGYYPSEREREYMTYEIYTTLRKAPNVDPDYVMIDFETFLRLYVNHRPVFGINKSDIEEAFLALGADTVTKRISRDEIFSLLCSAGEALHPTEVVRCIQSLLGEDISSIDFVETTLDAKYFAENLLGFEDYADNAEGVADHDSMPEPRPDETQQTNETLSS